MDKQFILNVSREPDGSFVFVGGNIDVQSEGRLQALPSLVHGPVVTVDFSASGRINSMGIALLLRTFRKIRDERGATIRLVGLNQMNMMLFRMTGIFLIAEQAA